MDDKTSTETHVPERRFIGRYEVKRLLGSGGMGQVYLAHDPVLDRAVAVKLIGGELDDEQARHRLVQEARAAGRLRHPNIVTIFDAGEHDGSPYIAMEHVRGETLRGLIKRRADVPLARRLQFAEGACAGLAHAHRANVVHLDIKPDNLMLDSDGVLKVVDFGIARVLKNEALMTSHLAGTLRYMSPEQISGRPLDRRSDVFSLGCSLFELVAYEPAFTGSPAALAIRIASGPVPRLADALPSVDPRLDALVAQAMALDPARRFDDLDELGTALGRLSREIDPQQRDGRAWVAVPAPLSERARPRRVSLAVGAVSALAIGSAAVWTMLPTRPDRAGAAVPASAEPPASEVATEQALSPPASAEPRTPGAGPQPAGVLPSGARAEPARAAPAAPAVASAPREDVWRRLAGGDRAGVIELLRNIERQEANPRIAHDVLDAVRPAVLQARTEAAASPAQRASPAFRVADESLARSTQLAQSREPIEALRAIWQAMDLFANAAVGARVIATPGPALAQASPQDGVRVSPPQPVTPEPARASGETSLTALPASESENVLTALRRYHQAYTALDAPAVRQMYPTLGADQVEQIRRSFEAVSAYEIELRQPRVEVTGNTAVVRALVARRIVPRVGRPVTSEVDTEFRLQRDSRGWLIAGVRANP